MISPENSEINFYKLNSLLSPHSPTILHPWQISASSTWWIRYTSNYEPTNHVHMILEYVTNISEVSRLEIHACFIS